MSYFYLRLTLIPFALFTLVLLVIHAKPYDDHELRELLLPKGCPAPCFMGIRPGVTTVDEAIKILNASDWVEKYDYEQNAISLRIKWSHNSPSWLVNVEPFGSYLSISNRIVTEFNLVTTLTIANIKLGIGQSSIQQISLNDFDKYIFLSYSTFYPDKGLEIKIYKTCISQKDAITYQDNVYLIYTQINVEATFPPNYRRSWFDVMHTTCG